MKLGTERAEQFAREEGVQIIQPRRKYTNRFKRQSSAFDFSELDSFE